MCYTDKVAVADFWLCLCIHSEGDNKMSGFCSSISIKGTDKLSHLFPQTSALTGWILEAYAESMGSDEVKRRANVIGELLAMTPRGDEEWARTLAKEIRAEICKHIIVGWFQRDILWIVARRFCEGGNKKYDKYPTNFPVTSTEGLPPGAGEGFLHDVYCVLNADRGDFWSEIFSILYE